MHLSIGPAHVQNGVGIDVRRLDDVQSALLLLYGPPPPPNDPMHLVPGFDKLCEAAAEFHALVRDALTEATERLLEDLARNVKLLGALLFGSRVPVLDAHGTASYLLCVASGLGRGSVCFCTRSGLRVPCTHTGAHTRTQKKLLQPCTCAQACPRARRCC
jgi:hypothetical protein